MKKLISIVLSVFVAACVLTACGPSQAEIDESIALESAQARLEAAEKESASIEESIAAEKEAEANKAPVYEPTDAEKELICGDWYRSKDDGEGDTDIYWLSMKDDGYCSFAHETMNSKDYIDQLEGTWYVDDHGFVNIDLGKYAGKFRFLKNAYGSTNIICNAGDDFVESGEEGAYAAFVPVKWYQGNLRFVEDNADEVKTSNATASDATASQAASKKILVEMQGEGDSWYRLAGVEGLCKVDVDTRDEEILCMLALNQNDHLIVKIQQIR